MGGFLTLAFAAVLAAVSSGVMQTGNVYDQADEYRMLALEGTDEATLDKARMMEVITPLNTVMAVSLGCSVLLLFPILATSLLNPASLLTLAAGIGLCYALMVLGGCAAIMRRTGSVMPATVWTIDGLAAAVVDTAARTGEVSRGAPR